jgi:hypothetical protein
MMPTQPTASRLEKMRFKKLGVGRVIEYVDHLHELSWSRA